MLVRFFWRGEGDRKKGEGSAHSSEEQVNDQLMAAGKNDVGTTL